MIRFYAEQMFVLFMAAGPTDSEILDAQVMGVFQSDFECSEVEADLEYLQPEAHIFCAPMSEAIKLMSGDPL